jgi:hypothetical protein
VAISGTAVAVEHIGVPGNDGVIVVGDVQNGVVVDRSLPFALNLKPQIVTQNASILVI